MQDFFQDIKKFNDIYKLPNNDRPVCLGTERLENFSKILQEELHEVKDLIDLYDQRSNADGTLLPEHKGEVLAALGDWLGDIIVYCASEARRWGLPLADILQVIMQSNFSKLGADGQPIYDDRGKVLKGPGYWKPEPRIQELLTTQEKHSYDSTVL